MYNETKYDIRGNAYIGCQIGFEHDWTYQAGQWKEAKNNRKQWDFAYHTEKHTNNAAYQTAGCDIGSTYHWLIIASQYATKIAAGKYDVLMKGKKIKLGQKQARDTVYSYEYQNQRKDNEHTRQIARQTLNDEIDIWLGKRNEAQLTDYINTLNKTHNECEQ